MVGVLVQLCVVGGCVVNLRLPEFSPIQKTIMVLG
jgi:hypothetical protein